MRVIGISNEGETTDGSGDDGGTTDDTTDGGSSLTRNAILSALGLSTGAWAALSGFATDLYEAESFADLVINVILSRFVGWILTIFEVVYSQLIESGELVAQSLWHATVTPVRIAFRAFWSPIFDSLESIRMTTESGLSEFGLAAPIAALGGWVTVLLMAAVLVGIVWALLETYLPVEAIVENLERAVALAMTPVDILSAYGRAAAESLRRLFSGGNT